MKQLLSTCQNTNKTRNLKEHKRSYHYPTSHIIAANSYHYPRLLQYVPKSPLHNILENFQLHPQMDLNPEISEQANVDIN
jgi:hypothetical protein